MTLHPTYVEVEHEYRFQRLVEEAANNKQRKNAYNLAAQAKNNVSNLLGNLLISVGQRLAGQQATT